ncbi:retrovirus-related pol polyprotein from transposon TNT 1-94 [Tanacetum coccineum]
MTPQSQAEFPQLDFGLVVPMFQQGEDPIKCINKAMEFLSVIASRFPPSKNQLRTSSNPRNQATIQDGRVTVQQVQGRQIQSYAGIENRGIATTLKGNVADSPPRVVKCYNCQGEGHMARQCTQPKRPRNAAWFKEKLMLAEAQEAGQILDEEQLAFLADPESQDAVIHDTNPYAPNDLLVLSLVEQMTDHVAHLDKENQKNKTVNELLTAKLDRYKERIAIFEQRLNVDLNKREKLIDSQMDDLIRDRNPKLEAFKQEINTLKETLYNNVKEKDVITKEHDVISVNDDEETLILEEESRSKMLDKQNDLISIKKKIKISPIDYSKLNKIKEDFGKRFVTQKEMSAEQAFWLKHSSASETPVTSHTPIRIEALSKLPKCLELEIELFKKKDFVEKEAYDKLVKSYSNLEKHCISLELATQLNQEIFQRENSGENLNPPTFNQLFEINELKARSQEKDTVIRKLKERIKSLSGKDSLGNVKKDIDEIEIIKIELEYSVAKLLSENENLRKEREHLKSIFKDQFDSIRKTRVQSKEHCDSLIAKINAKSVKNSDLNAQLQEKVFAITALKNELRKLKGENVVNTAGCSEVYIEKTIQYTDTLRGFVESARTLNPSKPLLESACMNTKHVQELLVYVSQTCPSSPTPSGKTDSLKTNDSNKTLLTSTGVKPSTSASGSKPSGNRKNNSITRPPRSNQKNKVEHHTRTVKSSLNKTNFVSEPISNALVKHSVRNAKFESMCAICNNCLFDANHDMCLIDPVNDVNVCLKSKSKRNKKRKLGNLRMFYLLLLLSMTGRLDRPLVFGLRMVYYVEVLRHNLFSVGQFCDADLKVAFRKNTCFIRNLEGVDILSGSPRALRKSKKSSYQPKAEDTDKEKLYLLHMDLCGPMRVESINEKKYILVIVDDYSRFTWVKFLRSKDEAPDAIIKCIKNIQVCLNATVRNVRTDNGTEFVNQTLYDFYENVVLHQTSVARTPQQNGVIERRNRTLVEAARTMLIF